MNEEDTENLPPAERRPKADQELIINLAGHMVAYADIAIAANTTPENVAQTVYRNRARVDSLREQNRHLIEQKVLSGLYEETETLYRKLASRLAASDDQTPMTTKEMLMYLRAMLSKVGGGDSKGGNRGGVNVTVNISQEKLRDMEEAGQQLRVLQPKVIDVTAETED